MWLALVPIGVAIVLGLLLVPRHCAPESVPLPIPDARALARAASADRDLADRVRRDPLPGPVRALGSAIRDFHALEADGDRRDLGRARQAVDAALIEALSEGSDRLIQLRAAQTEAFLDEIRRFEASGEESTELRALAGAFVRSMTYDGWCKGHVLLPRGPELRAMFKQMWNAFIGLETKKEFALSLDEQRALYAFYLSHAHPSKGMREAIESARRGARDAKACEALVEAEALATESWQLDHVARLAVIDSEYPADYARGVASYRRGDYGASASAFRRWLRDHPEGPFALRAQNYLRAAADADRVE